MIRRALLVLAAFGSCALAQTGIESAPSEQRPAPAKPQKLPDKLESAPVKERAKRDPDEIIATFFAELKADRVQAAYDTLKAESALADRTSADSSNLREQTQKALDAYGPMAGYELVREEKLGAHLVRRTYLLVGEVLPLRWKFYFYKPADRWSLIDLRIDDAIPAWFDESKVDGQ